MIIEAAVYGLLGEFDHEIKLGPDWEFAIAFGLNGVGKTKFLEMINATINPDYYALASVRFSSLRLRSSDGEGLEIHRSLFDDDRGTVARLDYVLDGALDADGTPLAPVPWFHEVVVGADEEFARFLIRNTQWTQLEGTLWEDRSDGEIADIDALRRMYGNVHQGRRPSRPPMDQPEPLTNFLARNQTYLIETQRLGVMSAARGTRLTHAQSSPKWTVDGYSSDLKSRLQKALADNSLRSQRLDRSFPRRVLNDSAQDYLSEEEIRTQFSDLNDLRLRLSDIGLTDGEDEIPLPDQGLENWQKVVLSTYIDDNQKKLSTFNELRKKIDLLEDLVNERFLRKKIDVSVNEGLTVSSTTDGAPIPASGLSSGEQHELVLIYNLLFRVATGSLVLIDEPEISLHVSWQKKFLDDLLRIAESSDLKFIVATHSPSIIGKWWSRTVQLGPTETEDD